MHPARYDLELAAAMADELEDFLISNEIFWPLERRAAAGDPPFPQLSLGGLLLTLDELDAWEGDLAPAEAGELGSLRVRVEEVRAKRGAAIQRKAGRELRSRANLWRAYVGDLEEEGARPVELYPHEVRQRVMAGRLVETAADLAEAAPPRRLLGELDSKLRRRFEAGPFVWDRRLAKRYPPGDYWFLYGTPRSGSRG
jgi:hypothetical protein